MGTLGGLSLCLSVEHFRRDREAARVLRRELEDCLEEYGLHWAYALPMSADGWLRVADGEVDSAIELLESGLAEIRSSGAAQATSILCATLAEAELARGRADAALEALDEAIQYVEKADERFWEAEIHRLRGESLRLSGDDTTAEESFAKSLEVSRSQRARSLALRGATSLARLWTETGRSEDARPVLSDALEGLTGGSDTADYQDAAALLATWSK